MFNWQNFRSLLGRVRYCLIFLAALWLSLGIPGCSLFPPNSQTSSSLPQPPQVAANTTSSTPQRFDETVINVLSINESIGDTVKTHISNFELQTGTKVNLIGIPVNDLYNTLWKDWSSGASKYDAATLVSQWMTDFAKAGYLEDLTQRVQTDTALQWQDVAPLIQKFSATYQGRIYAMPLDGDFYIAYYPKDLLEQEKLEPPATWEDYLAIAKRFHRKDLNGDGTPDYGSCIEKRPKEFSASILGLFVTPFCNLKELHKGYFLTRTP